MDAITRKTMLYKSKVKYMSGEGVYAMNHVLGCSHGCKYPCYAYLTAKRFGQVDSYKDWCEPKLVENTLELLKKELADHLICSDTSSKRPMYIWGLELCRGNRVLNDELLRGGVEYNAYLAVQDVAFTTPGPCLFGIDPDGSGWSLSVRAACYQEAKDALASTQLRIREALKPLGIKARFAGLKEPIRRVHMCFTTDPFPYLGPGVQTEEGLRAFEHVEGVHDASMRAIREINSQGTPVTILSKGTLPWLDASCSCGILRDYATSTVVDRPNPANEYGISLVSLDEGFHERWEPGSAPYADRIASLKALHDARCKTWISMEPWPTPTTLKGTTATEDDASYEASYGTSIAEVFWMMRGFKALDELLDEVSFVDKIVFGRWNYGNAGEHADYYAACVGNVRLFCERHNIECVIKEGTE